MRLFYMRRPRRPPREDMTRSSCWLLALALSAAASTRADDDRRAELEQVRAELAGLAQEVERRGAAQDSARAKLAAAERAMAAAERTLAGREAALSAAEQALSEAESKVQARRRALTDERQALAQTLRAVYLTRLETPLKLLLGGADPQRSTQLITWQEYLANAAGERVAQLAEALDELRRARVEAAQQHARAERLRARQARALAELEDTRRARAARLEDARTALSDARERQRARKQDAQRLEALMERLAEQRRRSEPVRRALAVPSFPASRAPFAERRGALPWPVPGQLEARFGQARESGQTRWQGALIAAPAGTPVRAVHGGRVVFADALRGFGLLVIVDHGGGYMTLYGYNAALHRAAGDEVEPGDVLADVGTGVGNAPGLYFEIRARGKPVDPASWCTG